MQPIEIIGQIISIIAVIVTFITYQMKSARQIFILLSVSTVISCVAFALLGGITALGLNIMSIVRNICFCYRDKNKYYARIIPALMALIMAVMSVFIWEGYHSLFFAVGITLNTLAMGYFSPQNLRKSILLTSTLILIYDLFIPSIGGVINELVAIFSSVIGLIRNRKKPEIESKNL